MTATTSTMAKRPAAILVIDTERTGDLADDIIDAIGVVHFPVKPPGTYKRSDFTSQKFVVNLLKREDETWKELWQRRGFSMHCFEDFIERLHLEPTLDALHAHPSAQQIFTSAELARRFNNYLAYLESEVYSEVKTCVDTADTDRLAVSALLQRNGYPILCFDRETGQRYQSNLFVGAIVNTLHKMTPGSGPKCDFVGEMLDPLRPFYVPHDHDPEHDALNIASLYVATQRYIELFNENARKLTYEHRLLTANEVRRMEARKQKAQEAQWGDGDPGFAAPTDPREHTLSGTYTVASTFGDDPFAAYPLSFVDPIADDVAPIEI